MTGKKIYFLTLSLVVMAIVGCGGSSNQGLSGSIGQTAKPTGKLGTAIIQGIVMLKGKPPVEPIIHMGADPICVAAHSKPVHAQTVVVGKNGGLANVFVYVSKGVTGTYASPSTPVTLLQKGCMYIPHVLGMMVNQPLDIINEDATLHNVHAMPKINAPFNVAQPTQGMSTTETFSKPEIMIPIKCDVHSWMRGYIGVVSNPFYGVSNSMGHFKITQLPAGTYTLTAWQEAYGTQSQSITITSGQTQGVTFTFNSSSSKK